MVVKLVPWDGHETIFRGEGPDFHGFRRDKKPNFTDPPSIMTVIKVINTGRASMRVIIIKSNSTGRTRLLDLESVI